jgi:2-polyprenyl-6-hydroxyphenyl methylase / 3-demethylubiquinone-9 3-methyltransferase
MMTQNIDPQELAKFGNLAAHWWDPNGELKTLHQVNPLRLGYITKKVKLAGRSIIDIGCGGGILAESMALQGGSELFIPCNKSAIT